MGNSGSSARESLHHHNTPSSSSNNIRKKRGLHLDPRSPTEGIVRTPIHFDIFDESALEGKFTSNLADFTGSTNGNIEFSLSDFLVGDVHIIDLSNVDGVLTEDDSMHRCPADDCALSDTEVNQKAAPNDLHPTSLPRARLSWMERLGKRKSLNDSPSLLVRLRQKGNYERNCKASSTARISQLDGDGGTGCALLKKPNQQDQPPRAENSIT